MARMVRETAAQVFRALAVGIAMLVAGWMVSVAGICVSVWILAHSQGAGFHGAGGGGLGAILGLVVLLRNEFWATFLLLVSLAGFVVHAMLAQKYVLLRLVHALWNAGQAHFLEPLVERCVAGLEAASPRWMVGAVKWATLKANLLTALGRDREASWVQRRAMGWILGKIPFEGEVPSTKQEMTETLVARIRGTVAGLVEPSLRFSGAAMAVQMLLMVVAALVG